MDLPGQEPKKEVKCNSFNIIMYGRWLNYYFYITDIMDGSYSQIG